MARRPLPRMNRLPVRFRPECPSLPYSKTGQAGFALVAVIWTLGLITLLGMAVIVGARYRTKTSSNYASVTAAEMAAESAVNLAIATALAATPEQDVKFPLRCRLPGGERATITIEEENGKIDLNTATLPALTRLFTALTRDQSTGTRIASHIVEFRKPPGGQAQGPSSPATNPAEPRFTTVMQLDQVNGISPQLFRTAFAMSRSAPGVRNPTWRLRPPSLLRLLNVEPKQAASRRGLPAGGSMTVRADIGASDGTRFIREALVSLTTENGRPFVIREWRRGDIDSSARQERGATGLRDCLRIRDAVAS